MPIFFAPYPDNAVIQSLRLILLRRSWQLLLQCVANVLLMCSQWVLYRLYLQQVLPQGQGGQAKNPFIQIQ